VEAVEAVSEILSRVAPGGTSVEPAFELVDEGLGARLDPTRPATVRAYVPVPNPLAAGEAIASVEAALGHLTAFGLRPIGELRTREVQEADWADAWKRHFPVLRIGRRLVIRPSWRRHHASPDEVVVTLDPGMAFGTGLHPTTRLSLIALERVADAHRPSGLARVLDVGCGSGRVAEYLLEAGASTLTGIDLSPEMLELARARLARFSESVELVLGDFMTLALTGPYDVIVAVGLFD
jgi:ribosomal protein L11 methyltransferase